MQDQSVPNSPEAQMAAWKQGVEERLRALETAPRISSTSQRGGSYVLLDDQGRTVWTFGEYTRGLVTDYGIQSIIPEAANATALEVNANGMEAPQIPLFMTTSSSFIVVTSGSFTSVYTFWASLVVSDSITFRGQVGCDASTTGEARLESGGNFSDVITLAAGTFTSINWDWLNPTDPGASFGMTLQVRRTSGAGNVNVYQPFYAAQGGSAGLGATPGGL